MKLYTFNLETNYLASLGEEANWKLGENTEFWVQGRQSDPHGPFFLCHYSQRKKGGQPNLLFDFEKFRGVRKPSTKSVQGSKVTHYGLVPRV